MLTEKFITEQIKLKQNHITTQIENHDSLIEYIDCVRRFNTILLGLCRDVWGYISLGYFSQHVKAEEVGSSTMPHKVNPIDFENAEANLGVAVSLAQHFAEKLPISRWQRDLSDSSVLRVLGTFFGHSLLSYVSSLKGLSKIKANEAVISDDLVEAWEVLAEPLQVLMKRYGVSDAYERLKSATRGQQVSREALMTLLDSCDQIPKDEKARFKELRPDSYVGLAEKLTNDVCQSIREPK